MKSVSIRFGYISTFIIAAIGYANLPSNAQQSKTSSKPDLKLWYKQAADQWRQALPIENGRLGAMVFGGYVFLLPQNIDSTIFKQIRNECLLHIDSLPNKS